MLDHLAHLRGEVARFQAAVGDLDAPVPACPEWRVRDLIHHVGSVHRMFRRVADEELTERPLPLDPDDRPDASDDRIVAWANEQADLLLSALERLDPDAPRWNFTAGPQVGAFIPRRMLHETTVHRWDLQGAYGIRGNLDVEVARDGVREYLEALRLRWGPWGGQPAVVRTEVKGGPTIDLVLRTDEPPDVRVDGASSGEPDALLRADAPTLFLAWWGRYPLTASLAAGRSALLADVRRYART